MSMISSVSCKQFAQKCKLGLNVLGAKLNKNVVKDIDGYSPKICHYGENVQTAKFQTYKDGTRILTNTNGIPRVITIRDGQVAVKEGDKIKVISDKTFIKSYEPVYESGEHYRLGLDGMRNARNKAGTKSYINICDEVIAKKDKELSDVLKQHNIEVLNYEPAAFVKTYDEEAGHMNFSINGKKGEIYHNWDANQTYMKDFLKQLLVDKVSTETLTKRFRDSEGLIEKFKSYMQ
jgi:hypothetical protein